jgi:hypothetical protein
LFEQFSDFHYDCDSTGSHTGAIFFLHLKLHQNILLRLDFQQMRPTATQDLETACDAISEKHVPFKLLTWIHTHGRVFGFVTATEQVVYEGEVAPVLN